MAVKHKKFPEKTETEILFPVTTVNKYTVEPWGLVEIGGVAPIIMSIIATCKKNKISLSIENLETELIPVIPMIIDDIIKICAVTVGATVEDIRAMTPRSDTVTLLFTILNQNIEYLKNLPGLTGSVLATIKAV